MHNKRFIDNEETTKAPDKLYVTNATSWLRNLRTAVKYPTIKALFFAVIASAVEIPY